MIIFLPEHIQDNLLDRTSEEKSPQRSCSGNDSSEISEHLLEEERVTDELFEDIEETAENINEMIHFENELSRRDISMMLAGLSYRHSLSKEAIVDIIKLIDILIGKKTGITNYYIEKQFIHPEEVVQFNFYCENCQQLTSQVTKSERKHQNVMCEQCNTMNVISPLSDNYFITLDLSYIFKNFLEDEKIQASMSNHKRNDEHSTISDVTDSELYKAAMEKYKFDVSFNFNTDGAPIFHSSKLSMWPIQLAINELPPEQRHRNILLAGIWFGKSEPNMNVYLNVFAENCKVIATTGVHWKMNGELKTSKIFPLFCCVDSVARPMIQNATQFNGFYGCSYCYHPGKVINKQVKYSSDVPQYTIRSSDEVLNDMQEAVLSGRRIRGIKGSASVINLPGFDLVWGYPIDYMHMVLLGVVRQTWEIWTTYGKEMYIGSPSVLKIINRRLLKICPPNEIHRAPRPLSEKAKWKASEWRSWLLFYSVPCLHGILESKYLEHFCLLQRSIYLLLKRKITKDDIELADKLLKKYVFDFEKNYGSSAMNFNVHLLSHLTMSVRKCGPLWATSNFHFESAIFKIKRTVKGPMGIDKQIIYKSLNKNILQFTDMKASCKYYLNDIAHYEFSGNAETNIENFVRHLGAGYQEEVDDNFVKVYNRVFLKNTLLCTDEYCKEKKNNNSCVKVIDGYFAKILKIYVSNNSFKFRVQKIECEPFSINGYSMENCWSVKNVHREEVIEPFQIVKKALLMEIDGDTSYLSTFPNIVEVQ